MTHELYINTTTHVCTFDKSLFNIHTQHNKITCEICFNLKIWDKNSGLITFKIIFEGESLF